MKDGFSDNAEENWLDCDDQAKEHGIGFNNIYFVVKLSRFCILPMKYSFFVLKI